jgi:F-type H+-transporting ATPase subunit b
MSAQSTSSGSGTVWVRALIGVALMFGGFYVSKNVKIPFLTALEESGISIDPGKTVAAIGVFLILFPILNMFFFAPLKKAIDDRNGQLERTFSEAEELRAEMTKMRADYERKLVETEEQARSEIQAQIREAQALGQQLKSEATSKVDTMIADAREQIERERETIVNELRLHVVDLALAAAEKVIGENMDSDKNRRLVTEFIEKAEVGAGR